MSRIISDSSSNETLPAIRDGEYRWMLVRGEVQNGQQGERESHELNGDEERFAVTFSSRSSVSVFTPQNYASDQCIPDDALFKQLVDQWRAERGVRSSTIDIILSRAYQSIIAMGQKAIPFILAQLEFEGNDPDQWFWALQMLTGDNPVSEEDEGNFAKMAQSWLSWAAEKGYAWKMATV